MKKTGLPLWFVFILWLIVIAVIGKTVSASQNPTQLPTASPYAGLTMLNNINSAFNTFQSNFSGATAPSGTGSPTTYQLWTDTTDSTLRFYDGSVWQPTGRWSGSQWTPVSNGIPETAPTSTGSSNAYVVTYSPAPTSLVTGQHYPFISNFQNTGAATEYVVPIGTAAIKKQGGTALIAADIVSGAVVDTVYDGTNFQMLSQLGNSNSGTVTSIATNNGLTGGTITASGTIGLASQSNNTVLSNISGSSAAPTGNGFSAVIDSIFGSTQGDVLYRGSSSWTVLGPGTTGYPLLTGGGSANPSFGQLPVAAISASGTASSSTYLRGDGTWSTAGGFSSCTHVSTSCSGGTCSASCSGGYTLTGGGCNATKTENCGEDCTYTVYPNSYPSSSSTWSCTGSPDASSGSAYAVCCH